MEKIVTNETMRFSDIKTIENGTSSIALIERAALAIYNSYSWHGKIGIICGKGNNGGDGIALSILLQENGFTVDFILLDEELSSDSAYYLKIAKEKNIPISSFSINSSLNYDIVVDAIFGTGFKGKVEDKYLLAINKINSYQGIVISIDINSGLNGDNGMGDTIVKSDYTIAIGSYKYGHFINKAKDNIKNLVVQDIGIEVQGKYSLLIDEQEVKNFFSPRRNFSSKGTYGYCGIIGGSNKYPGAIKLASIGQNAIYSGAGISKILVPSSISKEISSFVLESSVIPLKFLDEEDGFDEGELLQAIKGLKTLGIGVGLGQSLTCHHLIQYLILNYEGTLIIDADGLNILSTLDLNILNKSKAKIVLTPHIKEFSRLIKKDIDDIFNEYISYCNQFVSKYHVTLLLKGPSTYVASKEESYIVNSGCPGMATAGSGDVLTGILVGICSYSCTSLTKTIAIGAYINGKAGEYAQKKYGEYGMVSSDTGREVSLVIKDICEK
ncbi:MAG: NAD(P)H-hydrate dehydratase [Bacilli bacterium]